jgi:hypothetical protein
VLAAQYLKHMCPSPLSEPAADGEEDSSVNPETRHLASAKVVGEERNCGVGESLSVQEQRTKCDDSSLAQRLEDTEGLLKDLTYKMERMQQQRDRVQIELDRTNAELRNTKMQYALAEANKAETELSLKTEIKFLIAKLMKTKGHGQGDISASRINTPEQPSEPRQLRSISINQCGDSVRKPMATTMTHKAQEATSTTVCHKRYKDYDNKQNMSMVQTAAPKAKVSMPTVRVEDKSGALSPGHKSRSGFNCRLHSATTSAHKIIAASKAVMENDPFEASSNDEIESLPITPAEEVAHAPGSSIQRMPQFQKKTKQQLN